MTRAEIEKPGPRVSVPRGKKRSCGLFLGRGRFHARWKVGGRKAALGLVGRKEEDGTGGAEPRPYRVVWRESGKWR